MRAVTPVVFPRSRGAEVCRRRRHRKSARWIGLVLFAFTGLAAARAEVPPLRICLLSASAEYESRTPDIGHLRNVRFFRQDASRMA